MFFNFYQFIKCPFTTKQMYMSFHNENFLQVYTAIILISILASEQKPNDRHPYERFVL